MMRKILKEQDLSKIEWGSKHRYWFQYHNTFSGCRAGFTKLLKELIKYFGDDITKEANQLIVSFKRALIKDLKTNPNKPAVKEGIVKYLKPEFERIGIVWTDEDEEELKSNPTKKLEKKKDLVENSLWDWIMDSNGLYKTCKDEYKRKRSDYENRDTRDYKGDLEKSQFDYTKISGDNQQLQGKLKAANAEIERLKIALKNAGGRNIKDNKRRN